MWEPLAHLNKGEVCMSQAAETLINYFQTLYSKCGLPWSDLDEKRLTDAMYTLKQEAIKEALDDVTNEVIEFNEERKRW
jgi:hypothetical protein